MIASFEIGVLSGLLKEANQADWVDFFPKEIPVLPQRFKLEIKPHIAQVEVKLLSRVQPPSDAPNLCRIICRCHRNDFGSPVQFANHLLKCQLLRNIDFVAKLNERLKSSESFCSRIGWPMPNFLLRHSGGELELAQIKFHVHATRAEAPLNVTEYELEGDDFEKRLVKHATADIAGRKVHFVMPDGIKSKKIVIEFGNCQKDASNRSVTVRR